MPTNLIFWRSWSGFASMNPMLAEGDFNII
jgi:hypothetical protein